jgi:hypothetical protein
MTTEEMLEQKLDHVSKLTEKVEEQRRLLKYYQQRFAHMPLLAQEQKSAVGITRHHLEDAILDVQRFKQGEQL